MRSRAVPAAALFVTLFVTSAVPTFAQGVFGLGGRLSMIKTDAHAEEDAVRFLGGQIRARTSPRTALELSLDMRTDRNESETVKVRDMPVQASLLVYPASGSFSPYVLGGAGWYYHRVQLLAGDEVLASETTRDFGWHAGFGAELRGGRHFGVHGDYRYTFLDWKSKEEDPEGNRWLPNYQGSMLTVGLTLYF
ncbi:MAG: outer membrane beta-barrel protein [Vicinamibacterales bacterium]